MELRSDNKFLIFGSVVFLIALVINLMLPTEISNLLKTEYSQATEIPANDTLIPLKQATIKPLIEIPGEAEQCFAQTGFCIGGRFLEYWKQHGGITSFGEPVTNMLIEDYRPVQYFTKQRFAWYPENVTPADVQVQMYSADQLAIYASQDNSILAKLPLYGTQWLLKYYGPFSNVKPIREPSTEASTPLIEIHEYGINLSTSCNGINAVFAADYEFPNMPIRFEQILTTGLVCQGAIQQQASAMSKMLRSENKARMFRQGDTLYVVTDDGWISSYQASNIIKVFITVQDIWDLPEYIQIKARLVDITQQILTSEESFEMSQISPSQYLLKFDFDPTQIQAEHSYAIEVDLLVDNQLRYTSNEQVLVLTQNYPSSVKIDDLAIVQVSP